MHIAISTCLIYATPTLIILSYPTGTHSFDHIIYPSVSLFLIQWDRRRDGRRSTLMARPMGAHISGSTYDGWYSIFLSSVLLLSLSCFVVTLGGCWTIELHDFIELLLSDGGVMGEVCSWQQLWI